MNKLRKIIRNAWDVILAFALLCMAHFDGEAPEEYEGEFTQIKKNA